MRSSARKKKLRSFLDPGEISLKEKVFSKKITMYESLSSIKEDVYVPKKC